MRSENNKTNFCLIKLDEEKQIEYKISRREHKNLNKNQSNGKLVIDRIKISEAINISL